MDELPDPGGRDQHEQSVTNDPEAPVTADQDDAVQDDAEYEDADFEDADYDDAPEHEVANGGEYAGADYDGPVTRYAEDEDGDYEDAEYSAAGYDDYQYADGTYADADYQDADHEDPAYADADYQDSDYADADAQDGAYAAAGYDEAEAHNPESDDVPDPAAHPAPSDGTELVAPVPTADLLAPQEPAAQAERRDRRRVGPVAAFALGALVGVLLLGTVWATTSTTASKESAASGSPGQTTPQAAQVSKARVAKEQLARCRTANAAQARALSAADSTLRQWQVHVDAMNQLVVGTITFQQANEFWNKTRQGAVQRLMRYLSAEAAAQKAQAGCPRTAGRHDPRALRSCVRAVDTRRQELKAADVAIGTWRRHVRDMDRLRSGQLSPSMANQMWLANWQKGVAQLRAYRSAAQQRVPGNACHSS